MQRAGSICYEVGRIYMLRALSLSARLLQHTCCDSLGKSVRGLCNWLSTETHLIPRVDLLGTGCCGWTFWAHGRIFEVQHALRGKSERNDGQKKGG